MTEKKVYQTENNLKSQQEEQEVKVLNHYKDSVIVDLFGRCKGAKEHSISPYNTTLGQNLNIMNQINLNKLYKNRQFKQADIMIYQ